MTIRIIGPLTVRGAWALAPIGALRIYAGMEPLPLDQIFYTDASRGIIGEYQVDAQGKKIVGVFDELKAMPDGSLVVERAPRVARVWRRVRGLRVELDGSEARPAALACFARGGLGVRTAAAA